MTRRLRYIGTGRYAHCLLVSIDRIESGYRVVRWLDGHHEGVEVATLDEAKAWAKSDTRPGRLAWVTDFYAFKAPVEAACI